MFSLFFFGNTALQAGFNELKIHTPIAYIFNYGLPTITRAPPVIRLSGNSPCHHKTKQHLKKKAR